MLRRDVPEDERRHLLRGCCASCPQMQPSLCSASLSPSELGCCQLQQVGWAGRDGISCPYSWSPRLRAPVRPALPSKRNWTTLNLRCNATHSWRVSLCHGIQAATGNLQLPKQTPPPLSMWDWAKRRYGKAPLRPSVCQLPLWAAET